MLSWVKPNPQVQILFTWEWPKMTECARIISRINNSVISRCNPKIMAHAEGSQGSSEISETIPDDLRHIRTVQATCRTEGRWAMCCLNIKNPLSVETLCFIHNCVCPLPLLQLHPISTVLSSTFPKVFSFWALKLWCDQDLIFAWIYLPEHRLIFFLGADHTSGSAWGELCAMWLISQSLSLDLGNRIEVFLPVDEGRGLRNQRDSVRILAKAALSWFYLHE